MVCEVETSEPTGFLLKSITTNHFKKVSVMENFLTSITYLLIKKCVEKIYLTRKMKSL